MLDEEVIIKDTKHGNERLLILNVVGMFALPAIFFGGASDFISGLFIALGIIAPINVFVYKRVWVDADPNVIKYYLLALSPYILAFIITLIGISSPTLSSVQIGQREYFKLATDSTALITSASNGILSAVTPDLITLSCVACALSIYYITDSRYTIRRMLFFCTSIAAAIAILGFAYTGITSISGFENLPSFGAGSFFTFPQASWWVAFALLWLGAAFMISLYSAQRFRLMTFLYSLRFLSLFCAAILFVSILYCGNPIERILSMWLVGLGSLLLMFDTIPTKRNMSRHWTSKYARGNRNIFVSMVIVPCLCYAAVAITATTISIFSFINSYNNKNELLIVDNTNQNSATLSERRALLIDAVDIVELKPIFGWGTSSFSNVFSFYQSSDLGDSAWDNPHSELLQKVIENGFSGLFLALIMPFIFFVKWLLRFDFSISGMILLFALGEFLMLAAVDCPFHSIAVQISFWILLMSLFKWDSADVR